VGLAAAVGGGLDDGLDSSVGRGVIAQPVDKFNEFGRLQEDEAPRISKPHFGAAFPASRRIEGCGAQGWRLVDAAHAVDGDLLDEQFFFNQCLLGDGFVLSDGGFWFGLRFHGNPPGLT